MKLKHFVLLCMAALLVSLVSLMLNEQQAGESEFEHQAFIRNFNLSELDKLSIASRDGKVVLVRYGQQWVLPDHYQYGIDHEKLKSAMQKLQDAKIIELKTQDPKKHARLQLNELDAIDQQGVLVELTQNDKTLAVLLGAKATGNLGQYARLAGKNQSYLIDQRIDLPASHRDWIDKSVFALTIGQISQLTWAKAEQSFMIQNQALSGEFALIKPKVEETLKYPSIFTGLVRNLINTEAEDVKPLSENTLRGLSLGFSIELTEVENTGSKQLNFYQDNAEGHWLEIEGRNWLYQVSSFSYKQLAKPLSEYLNQEK